MLITTATMPHYCIASVVLNYLAQSTLKILSAYELR